MPTIDIVIVNWNSGSLLCECLESIVTAGKQGVDLGRVVVVDNNSSDDSLNCLQAIELPLHLLKNDSNEGFGKACNQGAAGSTAEFLLFLNPDMRLFKNSLEIPIQFMRQDANQRVAICGIQLLDEKNRISRSCVRFPSAATFWVSALGLDRLRLPFFKSYFMTEWAHDQNREVDQVIGAYFLVRREVYDSLSGFDERFFVYFEELDFSLRARLAGWRTYYIADAQAFHKGGGTSDQVRAQRLFYNLRSRILYANKHFSWLAATAVLFVTILLEPITRIVHALVATGLDQVKEIVRGYVMLWKAVPGILRTRTDENSRTDSL